MTHNLPDPVRLTRHDPDRNMARFYALTLEPTLFGEVALLRTWGRIGTRGQVRMETFAEANAAGATREKLERLKRRRGYSDRAG
ncbi:MAG TPA: WGR domain-containing protein [Albidovulum sp.]|uniref:WGR domain-containing protein n=1 Tax=Albidovulum sp. TaxID=1872424 RepID=UPI002C428F8E|nr:WGR domain-containing protein [Albidovulum sp.]